MTAPLWSDTVTINLAFAAAVCGAPTAGTAKIARIAVITT
jgi:hypothetical protein